MLIPSFSSQHSDLVPKVLRRYDSNHIQRREIHNADNKKRSSSFGDTHFREGDVNKEVRESIKKQKEMDEKAHQQDSFCCCVL